MGGSAPMLEIGSRRWLIEEPLALLVFNLCGKFCPLLFAFSLYQVLQFV